MRKDETYWDDVEDDREFDIDDYPRQAADPGLSGDSVHTINQEALPLEIRVKLGLFRLQLHPPDLKEAMVSDKTKNSFQCL
jgi:general transcription factor 3C polypeptide 3 (transcription factor C subunit 4)